MHIISPAHADKSDAQALRSLQLRDRLVWAAGRARSFLHDASDGRDGQRLELLLVRTQSLLA